MWCWSSVCPHRVIVNLLKSAPTQCDVGPVFTLSLRAATSNHPPNYFTLRRNLSGTYTKVVFFLPQVDYYRVCVLPLLKKLLPDNGLELKVCVCYLILNRVIFLLYLVVIVCSSIYTMSVCELLLEIIGYFYLYKMTLYQIVQNV